MSRKHLGKKKPQQLCYIPDNSAINIMKERKKHFENIESESRQSENGSACTKSKMARTASSVQDSQKKKRSSSTKSRQDEFENKLESLEKIFQGLEHNIGEKFDFLLEFLQKDKNQNTGGQATQRTDDNEQDNSQSVACRPSSKSSRNKDNDHSVECRPIISLKPNLDESLGSPRLVRHSMRDPDPVFTIRS